MSFKIEEENNNFYTIRDVPIFEEHDNRGFTCDNTWLREAVRNYEVAKSAGYRPTIIIGHNVKGTEKESVGFLDNLKIKGKQLFADLVRIPREIKEKIVKNAFPNRSVEILPKSKRILCMALLGGTTPHFSLPQMAYENSEPSEWVQGNFNNIRSRFMAGLTDDEKNYLKDIVKEAVQEYSASSNNTPEVRELNTEETIKFFQEIGDADVPIEQDEETGRYYLVDEEDNTIYAFSDWLNKAGDLAKRGGSMAKSGYTKVSDLARNNPKTAAGVGAGVAGLTAGAILAKRRANRRSDRRRYSIDDETGLIYNEDGEAVAQAQPFDDGDADDMDGQPNPIIPEAIPEVVAGQPILNQDPGPETSDGLAVDPGDASSAFVEGNVDTSMAGFSSVEQAELYNLQQEVAQLKTANSLLQAGKRAEQYKSFLMAEKRNGTPIGNINETVDYMMTLDNEGVANFKKILASQPKVSLGRMDYALNDSAQTDADIAADFSSNAEQYHSLGVSQEDLKYGKYLRSQSDGTK